MKKTALIIAGLISAQGVFADESAIRGSLEAFLGKGNIEKIQKTPVKGELYQVVNKDGAIAYATDDGKFVLFGDLIAINDGKAVNVTQGYRSVMARETFQKVDYAITYSKPENKQSIYVFTDISCGYCQKFDAEVQAVVDSGVNVNFIPYPRQGVGSPVAAKMSAVWCAADPKKAYSEAIHGKNDGVACEAGTNAVKQGVALGAKLGVSGTPSIFAGNGLAMGGYMQADRIKVMLDTMEKKNPSK